MKIGRIIKQIKKVLKDQGEPELDFERSEDGKLQVPAKYYLDPKFGIDREVSPKYELF